MVMEAAQSYRQPPADPVAPGELSRADLEARVAELERLNTVLPDTFDEDGDDALYGDGLGTR